MCAGCFAFRAVVLRIAWSHIYAHPLPPGHRFPMAKYELIPQQLLHRGQVAADQFFAPEPVTEATLLRVHTPDYWHKLSTLSLSPAEVRRSGFPLSRALVQREVAIAGGTVQAAQHALMHGAAMNVAGGTHHAYPDRAEGFCLLNDQAIAAKWLLDHHLAERVLIIDLDVHQGNGTAVIFQQEPRVFTFSMHGRENYPLHKEHSDLDVPLPTGCGDEYYLSTLNQHLPELMQRVRPDFAFYLSGVDVLATDVLGKLGLTPEGCAARDATVISTLKQAGVPLVVCMGGGYSPRLATIVDAHCRTFEVVSRFYF